MSDQKGFTLLEVMVALTILIVVLVGAFAFLSMQSRQGAGSFRKTIANEAATLSLVAIRKDILKAGLGLRSCPQLSIFVKDGGSTSPDELYVSCADYLDMDLDPDETNSFYYVGPPRDVPGCRAAFSLAASGSTTIEVPSINLFVNKTMMDSVITNSGSTLQAVSLNTVGAKPGTLDTNTNKATLRIVLNGSPFTGTLVPAISYKLDLSVPNPGGANPSAGALLRNGVPLIGGQAAGGMTPVESQTPDVKVTDFQIRCQFTGGTLQNVSNPFGSSGQTAKNLRLVEVTLRFILRDEGGGYRTPDDIPNTGYRIPNDKTVGPWMIGGTRTMTVSPRNLVLMQYL